MLGLVGILFGLYAIAAVIHVFGVIIGAVFSGIEALISTPFSVEGLVLGIAIGLAWYFLRKRNSAVKGE